MSRHIFQHYLDQPDIDWTCPACALPPLTDSFFEEVYEGNTQIIAEDYQGGTTQFTAECSTEGGLEEHNSDNVHLESLRNHLKNDVLVCHININSI